MSYDMTGQQSSTKYRVPALEKGLDILEALAFVSAPQSLADLARTLGRSSSEIFRMLNCLEARHYIARDEHSGNYALTLKLYELAHTHSPVEQLLRVAAQPMEELAQTLRESCHLSVLHQGWLVVLSQALSPEPVRLSVEVGGRFSMVHNVSGRLLLAQLPATERIALLGQDQDYQALSLAERQLFEAELGNIRRQGYATTRDENHIGVSDCAVLVGSPEAGVTAALTSAWLTATITPGDSTKILTGLRHCADQMTLALGFRPIYAG